MCSSDLKMSSETTRDFQNLQEKFGRFRILIVGRANAGKTTILQRICNSTEHPEVFDGDRNKVRIGSMLFCHSHLERMIRSIHLKLKDPGGWVFSHGRGESLIMTSLTPVGSEESTISRAS